jgi:hypothetical protein
MKNDKMKDAKTRDEMQDAKMKAPKDDKVLWDRSICIKKQWSIKTQLKKQM